MLSLISLQNGDWTFTLLYVTTWIWVCFGLVVLRGKVASTNQKLYSDVGSDRSPVWNFCSHSPDIMSQGNQWWHHKMSAVFSGVDFFKRNNYLLQDLEGEREVNKDEVLEYCNSSDVNIPLIETSAKVGRVVFPVWTVQYRVFLEKTI